MYLYFILYIKLIIKNKNHLTINKRKQKNLQKSFHSMDYQKSRAIKSKSEVTKLNDST